MTEFILVRHGESEHNTNPDFIGGRSHNARLTPTGEQQARLFGEYLREAGFTPAQVWTSGAMRTNQTAEISLHAAGLPQNWQEDERFHEVSQGQFEGQPRVSVYTEDTVRRLQREGLQGSLPGGESIADTQLRMSQAVLQIHDRRPSGPILIYSHGLAIRALAGMILKSDKPEILAMQTPNLSMTTVDVREGVMYLIGETGNNVIKSID